MINKVLDLQQKIFGTKHFRLKAAGAVVFMLMACMATMGTLTYISLIDDSVYQVTGLKVEQKGTGLNLTWDDSESGAYEVFLFENGQRPRSIVTEKAACRLELAQLGKDYKVAVTAKREGGGITGAVSESLRVHKVHQEIATPKEEFEGFEGNAEALKAEAQENIAYKSSNEKVVAVNDKGTLKYNGPGQAKISMVAEEGEQYKEGQKTVDVTVFPEQLSQPEVKLEKPDKDALTVKMNWSPVEFAEKYQILKQNPATEEYDVYAEITDDDLSVELPRKQAKYAVQANAEVNGQNVQSELSKLAEVKSPAADAQTYGSYHNFRTLDHSSLEVVATVDGQGSASVPQSMSLVGDLFVIAYSNHAGTAGALVTYDQNGSRVAEGSVSGMGHANGSTYNPNTGEIYTVKTHKMIRSNSCTTYRAENFSEAKTFSLPKNTSGIAYDESTDEYILSKGNELYVTDSDFNIKHFYWKKIRYNHAQDIGASDGVVLVCTWVNGNESYIDMYRTSDGEYIGGYSVPIGEIESVLVIDKHLYLLMNNVNGRNTDQIMKTIDPVALP